jgi:hypothetical protein
MYFVEGAMRFAKVHGIEAAKVQMQLIHILQLLTCLSLNHNPTQTPMASPQST